MRFVVKILNGNRKTEVRQLRLSDPLVWTKIKIIMQVFCLIYVAHSNVNLKCMFSVVFQADFGFLRGPGVL